MSFRRMVQGEDAGDVFLGQLLGSHFRLELRHRGFVVARRNRLAIVGRQNGREQGSEGECS